MKQKKGFTLLELLIVIAIIGTLSTLIFPNFMVARQKARDTKRQTDLKSIQNALEQYYSICKFTYPPTASVNVTSGTGTIICASPATTLMSKVPIDPVNTAPHRYAYVSTGLTYTLSGTLEIGDVAFSLSNQQ